MKRALLSGMTVLALAASVTACGGSEGLSSGDDYSVAGALSQLPQLSGTSVQVVTGDVVSAEQAADLTRPTALTGDWVQEWLQPLTLSKDSRIFLPYPGYPGSQGWTQPTKKAYGFSVLDVDSFANVEVDASQFTVVEGEHLDADRLPDGLHPLADGVVTDLDGADGHVDPQRATDANQFGRPVRIAARDHLVAASTSTDAVTAWKKGDADATLADDDTLRGLAQALDDGDVSSALLLRTTFSAGSGARMSPEQVAKLRSQFLPQSFDAVGVGWAAPDGTPTVLVVYHFAGADTASAAAPGLAKIWRHGTSLRTGEPLSRLMMLKDATADGDTVTVTLSPTSDGSGKGVMDMVFSRDLPFNHR